MRCVSLASVCRYFNGLVNRKLLNRYTIRYTIRYTAESPQNQLKLFIKYKFTTYCVAAGNILFAATRRRRRCKVFKGEKRINETFTETICRALQKRGVFCCTRCIYVKTRTACTTYTRPSGTYRGLVYYTHITRV